MGGPTHRWLSSAAPCGVVVALCGGVGTPSGFAGAQAAAPALRPEITREELEAHVRFLASDELDGRATGAPGAKAAARYLASALERQGVAPAAEDGTFLQPVRLVRRRLSAVPELALATAAGEKVAAAYGVDFDVARVPIALADARIVVVRKVEEVPAPPDAAVALFVDAQRSARSDPADVAGFALLVEPGAAQAGKPKGIDAAAGRIQRAGASSRWLRVRGPLLERLRKGDFQSLSLSTHVEEEAVEAWNVVGRIDAQGAADAAPEAVVLSAHYDHLGELRDESKGAESEDPIHNGADDDASGCAAVLEIAGAFAAGPRPARTLVFLFATGEEIGLLGTNEYLDHPVVPLERTVLNLNFEMIGRPDPLVGGAGTQWLTGWDVTNLGAALRDAGLAIQPDPRPKENFYQRSDNYAFVLRGVIGQTLSTYNLHADYHTVDDEADRLDYVHMEACARAGFEAARLVADGKIRPLVSGGRKLGRGR